MVDEIDNEGEGENKEKDDFELMNDSDMIRQIDFNSILFRQIDRTARYATEGILSNFGNAIAILDALCVNLRDKNFLEKEKGINDKFKLIFNQLEEEYKDNKGKQDEKQQMIAHMSSEKQLARLKLIMETLGRNQKL